MGRILDKINVTKKLIGKSEMTSGNAYRVTISYNGKRVWFIFNDNYMNDADKKELVECLWLDATAYEYNQDLGDFINEFGYNDDIKAGISAYNGCKKQYERFNKLFTKLEQNQIASGA